MASPPSAADDSPAPPPVGPFPGAGGAAAPATRGGFLLVTCQPGAEAALRDRQRLLLPHAAPAAWRRGVVTFRLGDFDPPDDFFPDLVFARTAIRSLGSVSAGTLVDRVDAARITLAHDAWNNVHVWHRDARLEAEVDATTIRAALLEAYRMPGSIGARARPGDLVLDCLVDTPDRWWVGWHRAGTPTSCLPGGFHPRGLPEGKVSRAWLKLDEAIAAFAIDLRRGQRAIELGAAPGGACQRLLEAGLLVVGVDPAVVDARVASHERFTQWRMRARDVKLRSFRGCDWIVADMNIDPRSTLAAVERIVTADGVRPRGLITTLKVPHWARAAELPGWLDRIRSWGFSPRARQLSTGGREICVLAVRPEAACPDRVSPGARCPPGR